MNNSQLDARLRAANPVPESPVPLTPGISTIRRIGQIVLAVIAALLVGVGVAWAASGTNPVAFVFADELKVVESDVGLESFSILEPMTQESLDSLPRGVAQAAMFRAISKTTVRNQMKGLPPFGRDKSEFEPDPALISAIGRTQTNLGTPVVLLVIDDEICFFTGKNGFGLSNCRSLEDAQEGKMVNWGSESRNRLNRVTAIYNDQVAAVDVLGDSESPVEVPGNVLELPNMRWQDITLVGLDDGGNELFRNVVPMSMKP